MLRILFLIPSEKPLQGFLLGGLRPKPQNFKKRPMPSFEVSKDAPHPFSDPIGETLAGLSPRGPSAKAAKLQKTADADY